MQKKEVSIMDVARKIILIAIDTLRADHLGCYGYKLSTSPNIDKIANQGVLFERHYATDVPTRPSFTALFSSQRGIKNGILGHENVASDFRILKPLLAEHFAAAGYRTGMISNLLYTTPWLVKGFKDIIPPGLRWQGGNAEEVSAEACQWLKTYGNGDFFLFVHYWDPHGPYIEAPEFYQKIFLAEEYTSIAPDMRFIESNEVLKSFYSQYHKLANRGETRPKRLLAYYDSEIRYVDDYIERIFQLLQQLNIEEKTLVIITSDHGEAFGEYGFFDHLSCYENVAHIPLIFWWPGRIPEGQRIKGFSLGVDLMPTLLELAGLPIPDDICGKSLVKVITGEKGTSRQEVVTNTCATVVQRMYIRENWALVHTLSRPGFDHIKEYELFNLAEDRNQEIDVSEKESKKFKNMRLALEDWLARELQGQADLLHFMVEKGGWAWRLTPLQKILCKHPRILLKDPSLRRILINKFGLAVNWLETILREEN